MKVEVKVSEQNIKDIETQLEGLKKPQSAVKTAVNNAAKRAQRHLVKKASKRYAGPVTRQAAILKRSEIKKASASGQQATVKYKSPVFTPNDYHLLGVSRTADGKISGYRLTKKGNNSAIKINVLKGPAKTVPNAFVARFPSGHIAVAMRIPGQYVLRGKTKEKPKKGWQGLLERLRKRKHAVVVKKNKHNQKIRTLLSPSYMKAIGSKEVYDQDEIAKIINEEVEKVIAKTLKGKTTNG
jgi:hypothetical protein